MGLFVNENIGEKMNEQLIRWHMSESSDLAKTYLSKGEVVKCIKK